MSKVSYLSGGGDLAGFVENPAHPKPLEVAPFVFCFLNGACPG
jgi:hypothetical protein